jgi:Ca2+-dependent lipid-binding protein
LGRTIKTSVVTQKNDEVFWGQEIWLPIQYPLVSSRIVMTVYDEDPTKNDIVGSMAFDIKEIIHKQEEEKEFPWLWKDVYAAPSGYSGKYSDEMDKVPELAS